MKNRNIAGQDKYLNTPCTITEAVQISRGVAEDVVTEYQQRTSSLHISMSLQIEVLKALVIRSGLITEEEFHRLYNKQIEEFNKAREELASTDKESVDVDVSMQASDINVKKESLRE